MEISDHIKAKVFAQYWGLNVLRVSRDAIVSQMVTGYFIMKIENSHFDDPILLLRPLSTITDEHADAAAKFGCTYGVWIKEQIQKGYLAQLQPQMHQYLMDQGYDLPHYLLGGKTLKEA